MYSTISKKYSWFTMIHFDETWLHGKPFDCRDERFTIINDQDLLIEDKLIDEYIHNYVLEYSHNIRLINDF